MLKVCCVAGRGTGGERLDQVCDDLLRLGGRVGCSVDVEHRPTVGGCPVGTANTRKGARGFICSQRLFEAPKT